jgi:glycosyltransferase involved in cell wall biosynthesis
MMIILEAIALCLSFLVNLLYWRKLKASDVRPLQPIACQYSQRSVAVIIPAYNEAENIADCVVSVLQSQGLNPAQLTVWVVDDQSTDGTADIVRSLQSIHSNPSNLHVLEGQPRPANEHINEQWSGKNWACTQAVEALTSKPDYLLFLDADVRLQPSAIATAIQTAETESIDLLTLLPQVICGCWAEWIAQPLAVGIITTGYPPNQVNDPSSDSVFAAGPFMFFRRETYAKIGGHRAIASIVLEDVELAKRIKFNGFKLSYRIGYNLASVRMYRTGAALWEGWTKNYYLGMGRSPLALVKFVLTAILFAIVPWIVLFGAVIQLVMDHQAIAPLIYITISGLIIAMHYGIRTTLRKVTQFPVNYWYLTGLGGAFVVGIAIASLIKVETGWGWTWRGRSLHNHQL